MKSGTTSYPRLLAGIALVAMLAMALTAGRSLRSSLAAAPFDGAIFTTLGDGTAVNHNIYDLKCDVYLNGGPQNQNSAGLPPNEVFYFQVTDPSGAALLSEDDAICRQVDTDATGRISGYHHDAGCTTADHPQGSPNSASGSTPVQLCPFDFTPNAGGEYKVWLIRKSEATISGIDTKALIFNNNDAKTDNFKVKERECEGSDCAPPTTIGGVKYYDLNVNGIRDGGEVTIAGWRIDVTSSAGNFQTYTDGTGTWTAVLPIGTTYTACEAIPGSTTYIQTGPNAGAQTADLLATANSSKCWVGTVGVASTADLDFGNVCLGAGGGLTLGFWSNNNGQKIMTGSTTGNTLLPAVQTLLRSLNLRNANGTYLYTGTTTPPVAQNISYSQFRTWILSAAATNMANMLSAQLAAMALNRNFGFVSGTALVYTDCTGFISINKLIYDATASLGANGNTTAAGTARTYQECLKTALDKANNNMDFVQGSPCAFTPNY
jgi:hypothetical protein